MAERFRDILKIWWSFCVVDFFRSLLALVSISLNSRRLAYLYQFLILNDFLGVAAVIILHAYRFQHSGKWCSGDFLDGELARTERSGFLIERGKILIGLVMYVWVGFLSWACVMSCLITAASRRGEVKGEERSQKIDESERQGLVAASQQPYEKEIRTIIAACQAASSGHVRILELLMKKGISINDGDYDKRTPLHVAVAAGQYEAVKFLLENGAQVNVRDRWNSTPLNDCSDNKELEALLLSKGAKPGKKQAYYPIKLQTLRDDDNRLFYAAFKNDLKNMAILKIQGWQVNAYDYDGRTALGIAASEGNLDAVKFLIDNKADPYHRDARGNNAFDDAIREGRQEVIEYLKGVMTKDKI